MKKYKGVITDPSDGDVVYEVEIEASGSHRVSPAVRDDLPDSAPNSWETLEPMPSDVIPDEQRPEVAGEYVEEVDRRDILAERMAHSTALQELPNFEEKYGSVESVRRDLDDLSEDALDEIEAWLDANSERIPTEQRGVLDDDPEKPGALMDKYALVKDRIVSGISPTASYVSSKYAALRPRVSRRLGHVGEIISIAAEEYEGGRPKPKRKPKPRKLSPRQMEWQDKYRRAMEVWRGGAEMRSKRRRSGRRSRTNAGMKSGTEEAPNIRVVQR